MATKEHEHISSMPGILLDALGVGAALLDASSGQILYANELFCRGLQYNADEISKHDISLIQLVHPEDRPAHLLAREDLLKGLIDRSRFDARYARRNGTIVTMQTTLTQLRNPLGQIGWMTCVLDEVTEPAIADRDPRLASDLATVSIWNWTPKTSAGRKPAGYDVLFGPPRAVRDPSIERLTEQVHPDDAKAVQLMLRRSLSGASGTKDYRRLGADGQARWVRETVTPIKGASGEVTNVVGMSIDVTTTMNRMIPRESQGLFAFVQHLETHWDKPLVLARVARDHKLSVRSLQKYFGSLGTTPLDFLKRIRLAHAYDMLSSPEPRTTVTKVSRRCGFGNLGHFAKDYRSEFGELPSETLLRSRTRTGDASETGLIGTS